MISVVIMFNTFMINKGDVKLDGMVCRKVFHSRL